MSFLGKAVLKVLLIMSLPMVMLTHADTQTGLTWLNAQTNADNNYTTNTNIATPSQSLTEMAKAISLGGGSIPSIIMEQINATDYNSTSYLSEKIQSNKLAGRSYYAELNLLLKNQTRYGSFGEQVGFDGTVLDTALALESIYITGVQGDSAKNAISYILSEQQANGSWHDGNNLDSVYVTAHALKSLSYYSNIYNISSNLDKAYTFLQEQVIGLTITEPYLAAHTISAMLSFKNNKDDITSVTTELLSLQEVNGSWQNDIYITSVVLQALLSYEKPNINVGSVTGSILSGLTSLPLENVEVVLVGDQNITSTTNAQGEFRIKDIPFGEYKLVVNADTFQSVYTDISVLNNINIQISPISLSVALNTQYSTIKGHITDSETSEALKDAIIMVNGLTAKTDLNGDYELSGITSGTALIEVEKLGYVSASTTTNLQANSLLIFSPKLLKTSSAKTSISGIVKNAQGIPLQGASIELSLSNTLTTLTDAEGKYEFNALNNGNVNILVSKDGFQSANANVNVEQNKQYNFSPSLYTLGMYSIKGKVIDAQTNEVIEGASIQSSVSPTILSAMDGTFILKDFNSFENTLVDISISANNYNSRILKAIPLSTALIDIGTIGLDVGVDANNSKIIGTIIDAQTKEVLAGVQVKVDGTSQEVTTDAAGKYILENISQEDFSLLILKDGFRTKEIPLHLAKSSTLNLDISLEYFQASGLVVETLASDKGAYSAYEPVSFSIRLINEADLTQKVQLVSEIVDSSGNVLERKQLNGAVSTNTDTYDNILPHSDFSQEALWYTSSNIPGEYIYNLRVIDPFTQNLLADTSISFSISPTQKLDKLCMKTNPSLTYTGATKTLKISTMFSSHSNTNLSLTYLFKLIDPKGTVINSKEVSVDLSADETSKSIDVDEFIHTFSQSGQYQVTAELINGVTPLKIESALITVLPSIHIEASQNLSPKIVTPDGDKNIRVNVQLKGVVK